MKSSWKTWSAAAALAVASFGLSGLASAQVKEVVMGFQIDRTGPTQNIGVPLAVGYHDYVDLVNANGGIDGVKLRISEVDNEYKVPPAVEGYERQKKDGAALISFFGTASTLALIPKTTEDKIPGMSPGFGSAASANGKNYPYTFLMAASYWSQAAAAVKFAKDQLGGSLKGKKIAYLYYDNPAGKEPLPILEDISKIEGFQLKEFAVPPPGLDMTAQALDIAQRYRADFVIAHLFGRAPSVSIKALKGNGYPLKKMVSFVWGGAEDDILSAGGYAAAEGYNTLQFAGVGSEYKVLDDIRAMYKKAGKEPPKEMASTAYYNRGVFFAALQIEAIRNALKLNGGKQPTGVDVKNGFEHIKGFTLGGIFPPLEVTPDDHEGGGWVKVFQVKGGKLVGVGDWFHAYPDVLKKHIAEGK